MYKNIINGFMFFFYSQKICSFVKIYLHYKCKVCNLVGQSSGTGNNVTEV